MDLYSLLPSGLAALEASVAHLPQEDRKYAMAAFLRDAIADYKRQMSMAKGSLIVLAALSLNPVFLLFLIPALIFHTTGKKIGKLKILNALEAWKSSLGEEYPPMFKEASLL